MTKEEYFGDWLQVLPEKEMKEVLSKLSHIKNKICPEYKDIFKAFNKCPYKELRLVVIGQDPYPQKGAATGLAFANNTENLSPSLEVIKKSVVEYNNKNNLYTFVPDLENWARQGVLLLNTALTCKIGDSCSHSLLWRPFISKLIRNICLYNPSTVFLLLGNSAQSFASDIIGFQHVIIEKHPAYYYRNKKDLSPNIWKYINDILIGINGYGINF